MDEIKKPPFEQAADNIRIFTENADMLQSLSKIKQLLVEIEEFEERDKQAAIIIIEASISTLSKYIEQRGDKWN